jgi:hypothetical protein
MTSVLAVIGFAIACFLFMIWMAIMDLGVKIDEVRRLSNRREEGDEWKDA